MKLLVVEVGMIPLKNGSLLHAMPNIIVIMIVVLRTIVMISGHLFLPLS
jgi:hypothetical protein